jgi:hypothetical protein
VGVGGFDPGEHRLSFEAEVPIGEACALLEPYLPGGGLRIVPGALRYAALEAAVAAEVCTEAKEVLAMPRLAN